MGLPLHRRPRPPPRRTSAFSGPLPRHTTARARAATPHGTAACSPSYTGSLPADHGRHTMPGAAAPTYRPAIPSGMHRRADDHAALAAPGHHPNLRQVEALPHGAQPPHSCPRPPPRRTSTISEPPPRHPRTPATPPSATELMPPSSSAGQNRHAAPHATGDAAAPSACPGAAAPASTSHRHRVRCLLLGTQSQCFLQHPPWPDATAIHSCCQAAARTAPPQTPSASCTHAADPTKTADGASSPVEP